MRETQGHHLHLTTCNGCINGSVSNNSGLKHCCETGTHVSLSGLDVAPLPGARGLRWHRSHGGPERAEIDMYSGVSTDGARRVGVIPAHAGIQAVPRIWIPASAGMTLPLSIHVPGRAFNMHNTL